MGYSTCCGVEMTREMEDVGICPDCKEHCEVIGEEDEIEDASEMTAGAMDRF